MGDTAIGTQADPAATGDGTVIALLKQLRTLLSGGAGGTVLADTELPAAAALTDATANPTVPGVAAFLQGWNTATWDRVLVRPDNVDGVAAFTGLLVAVARNWGWNGAAWDRMRVPNLAAATLKSVAAVAITAGTGATIWTPTSSKKFRLMGWILSVSAACSLIFGDNAVGTVILRGPLLAAAGVDPGPPPAWGNGFLSAAANNVLKLDVTATATVSGYVFGTEE
jgi:hypothetical protein